MIESQKRLVKTYLSRAPQPYCISVCLTVMLICTFVSQFFWSNEWAAKNLTASREQVFSQGQVERLVTSVFAHSDLQHLLSNLYMLGILGYFVVGYFGIRIFPFYTLVLAIIVNALTVFTYPPQVGLLGASGWVYVLAGFWLTMFFLLERKHDLPKRIVRVIGVALMTLFPTSFEPQVSYRAHAFGFVIGLVYALIYFRLHRTRLRQYEEYLIIEDSDLI